MRQFVKRGLMINLVPKLMFSLMSLATFHYLKLKNISKKCSGEKAIQRFCNPTRPTEYSAIGQNETLRYELCHMKQDIYYILRQ